jgi:hypothetical protein
VQRLAEAWELHSRRPGRSSKAVRVHANRGLRVPVACVVHAANDNDGLDTTAEDEVVCGVAVELFFCRGEGNISLRLDDSSHRCRCESEMRYSAAMDPRVGDRVKPTTHTRRYSA